MLTPGLESFPFVLDSYQVLDGEALKIEEEKLRAIGQRNRTLVKLSATSWI